MLKQYGTSNLLMAGGVLLPKLVQWTPSGDQHTRFEVSSCIVSYLLALALPSSAIKEASLALGS